jgi:hypothetical protein
MLRTATLRHLLLTAALLGAPLGAALGAETAVATPALGPIGSLAGTLAHGSRLLGVGSTAPFRIWLDRFSTEDEVAALGAALAKGGQPAVERAFNDVQVGRLLVGDRGFALPIVVAWKTAVDGAERLVLIVDRPLAIGELRRSARSLDYPFTVVELDLSGTGPTGGNLLAAARLRQDAAGVLVIQGLNVLPNPLLGVHRLDS